MAKPPTTGIQTLPDLFATNLLTLAGLTALQITDDYATGLKKDFLLKKIRVACGTKLLAIDDEVILGFCRGDMTVAEIASALGNFLADPEKFSTWDEFVVASGIYWQTVRFFMGRGDGTAGGDQAQWNEEIQIGGGKGIPIEAGAGIQMFAFNPSGGALTTGAQVLGLYSLVGVFLVDSQA